MAEGSDRNNNLVDIVKSYYPDILKKTYSVPPLHFKRVPMVKGKVHDTKEVYCLIPPRSPGTSDQESQGSESAGIQAESRSTPGKSYKDIQVPGTSKSVAEYQDELAKKNIEGNMSNDFAQQHVLYNLHELGKHRKEAMFVVSELDFGKFLARPMKQRKKKELPSEKGDFDITVISRQWGILICELKSKGWIQGAQVPDRDVESNVADAVSQLARSKKRAEDMLENIGPSGLTVRTTIILPYVSTEQLTQVLASCDQELKKKVFDILEAKDADEAAQLCCCSDQLSDRTTPWEITEEVLSKLDSWWQRRMTDSAGTTPFTDESYLDIVSSYVGRETIIRVKSLAMRLKGPLAIKGEDPAKTEAEARTEGDVVSLLSQRLELMILTPEQIGLLDEDPKLSKLVCLTGPPGTGKTVVMELQGLRWLLEGQDVHTVSTAQSNRAIHMHIKHQLETMLKDPPQKKPPKKDPSKPRPSQNKTSPDQEPPNQDSKRGRVIYHNYNFKSLECKKKEDERRKEVVDQAVQDLKNSAKDGKLYLLMDEANFTEGTTVGPLNRKLVAELVRQVPGLHLWAARLGVRDVPPELEERNMTLPLRSAPSILREVKTSFSVYGGDVPDYSSNGIPAPGDGLKVVRLTHQGDSDGHTGPWPYDCEQCGHDVAAELRRLRVGAKEKMTAESPPPLRYGDVFVLTRSLEQHDAITEEGGKERPPSGFVRGLRDAEGHPPVCVLGSLDNLRDKKRYEKDMAEVATGQMDKIIVAYSADVQGLERPVVVLLAGKREGSDDKNSPEKIRAQDRLMAASRAMAQLIVVDVPNQTFLMP